MSGPDSGGSDNGGPVGVGIIGAGVISKQYLTNLTSYPDVEVVAIGDLVPEAARTRAEEFGIGKHGDVDSVLADPEVELVVNLTIPAAHASVGTVAVDAGKHLWNEKPLTDDLESAKALLAAATTSGVRVGCAPDTVLGAGWQAVRRVIESGAIGEPKTAQILFQSPGPEKWHPNPDFLFKSGGGPLLDIGPYYLTALTQVFGPVASVEAVGSTALPQRIIGDGPRAGETFDVTVPTHVGALLQYADGGIGQAVFSFESAIRRTVIEISGTEGALVAPDPNQFGGEVVVTKLHETEAVVAATADGTGLGRGIGVVDMVRSIRAGEPHRASGEQALHILDVMLTAEARATGGEAALSTTSAQPALLPEGWDPKAVTLS